jgi:hypothetical protein
VSFLSPCATVSSRDAATRDLAFRFMFSRLSDYISCFKILYDSSAEYRIITDLFLLLPAITGYYSLLHSIGGRLRGA